VAHGITSHDVVIIGGGPVGLFLGVCLQKTGVDFCIVERRRSANPHSRAIGIHPPVLEYLRELGLVDNFLRQGVTVRKGIAFNHRVRLGELSFTSCRPPFNFVLSIPQQMTEMLLEAGLTGAAGQVIRGSIFDRIELSGDRIRLEFHEDDATDCVQSIECRYLVGCDGKNSSVRTAAGILFNGAPYPDTYLMGDFPDATSFGSDAAVFLHPQGVVESFPLPAGRRRWVARTSRYVSDPEPTELCGIIRDRTRIDVNPSGSTMVSAFGVQHYMAEQVVRDRVFLCGDAAHVISPIGGQGMNLGFMDAWDLVSIFRQDIRRNIESKDLMVFTQRMQQRTRIAMRRAEINMKLGRASRISGVKTFLVQNALRLKRTSHAMANQFTMRNLNARTI